MFKKRRERREATNKRKDRLKYFCDNINDSKVQLELIKDIQNGEIKFGNRSSGISGSLNIPYSSDKIKSEFDMIVYCCEFGGAGSFSYLFMNGKDVIDELKYGTEIALTIQNPEKNWVKNK